MKNIHYKKKLKDVDKVILNIVNKNKDPIRLKLYENITIESAKRLEKYLIKLIGRKDLNKGSLANLTNGAEGFIGFHDKKWILISPYDKMYLINKSIRKNLKRFNLEYKSFKVKNGKGITENGWVLKERKEN